MFSRSAPRLFALVLFATPVAARAQANATASPNPLATPVLPPTSAAIADDATASVVNPAGLAQLDGSQLFYVHERSGPKDRTGNSLFLAGELGALGLGFTHQWVNAAIPYRRSTWSLGLGSPTLSLGAAFHFLASTASADLNRLSHADLGLLYRPSRWLSLGGVVKSVDAPTSGAISLRRVYQLAAAVRPFGERVTAAVDLSTPETDARQSRLSYTLVGQPWRGLSLGAGLSHGLETGAPVSFQLSLGVNLPRLGVTYAGGGAAGAPEHLVAVRASTAPAAGLAFDSGDVAMFDLDDQLSESGGALSLLGFREPDPYLRLTRELDRALRDPDLRGLLVKIDGLPGIGLARAEELRQVILAARARGKKVLTVLLSAGDKEYLVASAADRVYAVPGAMLQINGLAAQATYLGASLDKLGVHIDVTRVGAYKNAPDRLTRKDMSKEEREALDAVLDDQMRALERALAEGRKLSPEQVRAVLAEGLLTPERAKELGLVDALVTSKALADEVRAAVPGARYVERYRPRGATPRWGTRRRIAIVPVVGSIAGGKSRKDPLGAAEIAGAETVVRALEAARSDPSVVAIVVRVDSGGGDTLASELMYRAVLEAREKKPVIASMGDTAASGGYYAAMGAHEVYASPTTVTGSIGVFFIKPSFAELGNKLGARVETLRRGELSTLTSPFTAWGPAEQAAAKRWTDQFYDGFITEVARSRKLSKSDVDAVARGRVWSGEAAVRHKLVDKLGGLQQAIAAARARANLSEDEEVDLTVVGEPKGLFASLGGEEGVAVRLQSPLPPLPEALVALARDVGVSWVLLHAGAPLAVMPYTLRIE